LWHAKKCWTAAIRQRKGSTDFFVGRLGVSIQLNKPIQEEFGVFDVREYYLSKCTVRAKVENLVTLLRSHKLRHPLTATLASFELSFLLESKTCESGGRAL
jgi:hypothetical protein